MAFVNAYKFAPGEQLNVIGFSHGGNVAILSPNLDLNRVIDNLVTLGTPSRPGYRLLDPNSVGRFINVFNSHDQVQTHGGGDFQTSFESGAAARTQPFALNLNWNLDFGPKESHSQLHSPEAWDFVLPHLDLNPRASNGDPQMYVID